jgi:hypothetical protein
MDETDSNNIEEDYEGTEGSSKISTTPVCNPAQSTSAENLHPSFFNNSNYNQQFNKNPGSSFEPTALKPIADPGTSNQNRSSQRKRNRVAYDEGTLDDIMGQSKYVFENF